MKMIIECRIRSKTGYLLEWKLEGDLPEADIEAVGMNPAELLKRIWDMEQRINDSGIRAHVSIEGVV